MSQDLQGVGSVSDRIHARYMLERSKRELAATRANIRAYDAANPKSRLRQYLVIGGGAFAAGCAVMALVIYKPSPNNAPVIAASKAPTPPAIVNPPAQPIPAIPAVPTASPVAAPSTPAIPSVPQATKPAAPPIKPTSSAAPQTSVKAAPNTTKAIGVLPIRESAPQSSPAPSPALSPTPSTPSGAAITPPVLSHAKDKEVANGGDELGFKPKTNYAVVGIPADGVVMVKKNGETVQQLVRVGSKLPDGEELRAANPNTKEIETSARKFSATQ
jgi:hypothetical protein